MGEPMRVQRRRTKGWTMPPARNKPGFLRAECRVIGGLFALRLRVRRRSTGAEYTKRRLNKILPGRDRPWQDKQMRMPPHQLPANAWSLWGCAGQVKQRLYHLGRLPKRHQRTPITMWCRDGIGRIHSGTQIVECFRASRARAERCDAILARLAKTQAGGNGGEG